MVVLSYQSTKFDLKPNVSLTSAGNRFQLSSVAFGDSEDKKSIGKHKRYIFFISIKIYKKKL